MYKMIKAKDTVRVSPEKFGMNLEEAIIASLKEKYEGILNRDIGIVLSIEDISDIGEGKVLPVEGAAFYPTEFKMLVFEPLEHEVVIGEVVDMTEFGAFVRIGPIDALVHVSQVMNDYVNYDEKNNFLVGKDSGKKLRLHDIVRVRIISVSYTDENKVGLTMRQPHLGALQWFEDEDEEEEENNTEENEE